MTVLRILNEKGREVVTTPATVPLEQVAQQLRDRNIGAVIVVDGDAIIGILSERDIVRAVAAHGSAALAQTAGDCMTAKVVTCRLEDTIDHVMQVMTAGRFRHLPVVEGGELVGLVSIGDVVKRRIEEVEREAEQIREYISTG